MSVLVTMRDALWAVFVDDGLFAGAIVVWLVAGSCLLPRLGLHWLAAMLLFAGLAAILVFGAWRGTRQRGG